MTKIYASLALSAALGAGFAAGAQAQTVANLGPSGTYALQVTTDTPFGEPIGGGVYEYSYTATLLSNPALVNVNSFTIANIAGSAGIAPTVTNETTGLDFVGIQPGSTASFTAVSGFFLDSSSPDGADTAQFNVFSTLPPGTNTVSVTSNASGANGNLGGTGSLNGPGGATTPTIPETSSFALLGLGLLPLGFLARRRIARNS